MKALLLLMLASCELFVDVPNGALAIDARATDSAGGNACASTSMCASPTPQCDTAIGTCVACLTSPDCAASAPVCEADACRGCDRDAECPGSVCLGDGTCADPARVLYASVAGVSATCAEADPCSLDTALGMIAATHNIVKLAAGTYERTAPVAITQETILTGEGAVLHGADPQMSATMFTVTGAPFTVLNAHFELANEFAAQCMASGALHFSRVHLVNGAAGAYANACAFTLDRSLVDGNQFYGFYLIGANVAITNSFITNNGSGSLGGLVLSTGTVGTIEHVTLSGNTAGTMGSSAIRCTETSGLAIRSSIVYGNGAPAIDAACVVGHSVIDGGYLGTGTANLTVDPAFVAPTQRDYHIQPGSPAVGLADPTSMLRTDYDGDQRPQPAGTAADSGADEIP